MSIDTLSMRWTLGRRMITMPHPHTSSGALLGGARGQDEEFEEHAVSRNSPVVIVYSTSTSSVESVLIREKEHVSAVG